MSPPKARARGRLITLEGGEGTGKSTQARRLADYLRERGKNVVITREPGGSPGAEAVRGVILSGAAAPLGPEGEALLFAAARADHVDQVIRPALEAGRYVVCDRFIDSTRVYQGMVGKVDRTLLRELEDVVASDVLPDLTVILDTEPETGLARAAQRSASAVVDRFEREGIAYHRSVRDAFRTLARQEPKRCVLVDAKGDVASVHRRIRRMVDERLFPAQKATR